MNISDFLNGNRKIVETSASTGAQAANYPPPDTMKYPQPVNTPTPDWEDVRQTYPEYSPVLEVPVCVERPIMAWVLPAKRGMGRTFTVDTLANVSNPNEVIPANPKLRRVILVAGGAGVVVGTREQVVDANGADGFTLPNGTPVTWEGFEEPLYAVVQTAGTKTTLSVRYEYWAD